MLSPHEGNVVSHKLITPFRGTRLEGRRRCDVVANAQRRDFLLGGIGACCCGTCTPKTGWYDKFFAGVMANGMNTCEVAVRPFKEDLLKDARQEGPQRVLEVGIGAAPNLSYLVNGAASKGKQEDLEVVGIDPNPFMFSYARQKQEALGLPARSLDLQVGIAEDLPLENASIDTIICTLVLCSVNDVSAAVREMRRVLKPRGRVYFLEHVIASPDRKLLRFGQQILNPIQQVLADGCHLTRNPLDAFYNAGFADVDARQFDVPGWGLIAPTVAGIATA